MDVRSAQATATQAQASTRTLTERKAVRQESAATETTPSKPADTGSSAPDSGAGETEATVSVRV